MLLLHGFPETGQAWKEIAWALADDHDVHRASGLHCARRSNGFSYAPRDYARVLKDYIARAGIDRSKLTIYAADIGTLPVLLLALEEPDIARMLIVGDFAPFNRPAHM